ncbi:putative poly(ADP)-ribose polymerase PARP [Penicillium brasilianum]|uniref:Poly [ADP-ribose] polymerase n=1 Tax=Penicillium brasilianum TaxID=104259 RepID=A0A1S9RXA3_PENBI|nr:putative poly(ADP)-ribose polymerase PARP [Penicillium brasilianum]
MAPRSFKNTVIAVSGTLPGYKQADVKALVEQHGATFSSSVTDQCTHLITTLKDIEKQGIKYQAASKLATCQIVSIDWLVESAAKKKPISEKPYLLDAGSTPDAADVADAADENDDTKQNGKRATRKAARKVADKDVDDAGSQDPNGDGKTAAKKGTKSASSAKTDKKRAIKDEEDDAEAEDKAKVNKKQKNSQKASSKSLIVPVDETFMYEKPNFKNPQVYIEKSGLIWDATLNQTNSTANNNKFYRIQILTTADNKSFVAWTRWGRVGEHGQSACLGDGSLDDAKKYFEKKFKDKSGLAWKDRLSTPRNNKYTFLERNYEEDDEEAEKEKEKKAVKKEPTDDGPQVESKLEKPIQDLMAFIFNQQHINSALASMSYDAQKLPLGKLSERTLKAGFSVLKELAEILVDPSLSTSRYGTTLGAAQESLSNRYFTLIPHVFGRNRPPILVSDALIRKEVELLEALTDMDVANEILKDSKQADEIHALDRQFQSLGMEEMTRLDRKSTEFSELSDYLNNSRGATHNQEYQVIDIFRIERQGETDRFTNSPFANLQNSDRRLLWHGSRSTNFGGILSQGLRIAPPEAPVNGYMFGKGVYLADTSSKSAGYCCAYNSANSGLLLLCDAELGDPMLELAGGDYHAGEHAKKEGKIATLGMGRAIPGGWKDAGVVNENLKGVKIPDAGVGSVQRDNANVYLQYNEYIVYDVAQIRQRYLFYVRMR